MYICAEREGEREMYRCIDGDFTRMLPAIISERRNTWWSKIIDCQRVLWPSDRQSLAPGVPSTPLRYKPDRQKENTPNLPTNITPTKIAWLKLSGKFPMGLGIPPLNIKIMLESNPLKSVMLVRRLAVQPSPQASDEPSLKEPVWQPSSAQPSRWCLMMFVFDVCDVYLCDICFVMFVLFACDVGFVAEYGWRGLAACIVICFSRVRSKGVHEQISDFFGVLWGLVWGPPGAEVARRLDVA